MSKDPIHGKTLTFFFDDGPMAGKAYEHRFGADGKVTYHPAGGKPGDEPPVAYEVAQINEDVWAVSYLGGSGYTLTTVIDTASHRITGFASNDKALVVQHGHLG